MFPGSCRHDMCQEAESLRWPPKEYILRKRTENKDFHKWSGSSFVKSRTRDYIILHLKCTHQLATQKRPFCERNEYSWKHYLLFLGKRELKLLFLETRYVEPEPKPQWPSFMEGTNSRSIKWTLSFSTVQFLFHPKWFKCLGNGMVLYNSLTK